MILTVEQEFALEEFKRTVELMTADQRKDFLVKLYAQMLIRESMYKEFLKYEWGIVKK